MVDGDARRSQHLFEDPQRPGTTDATRRDRDTGGVAQFLRRSGVVERRRIEPHPVDRVPDDRFGQLLGRPIVGMHGASVPPPPHT